MASGPATPPAEEPPRDAPDVAARDPRDLPPGGEPPRGEERYGPLDVLRTRKDDGRSLTLYSREERRSR